MIVRLRCLAIVALLGCTFTACAQTPDSREDYRDNPKFQKAMADAREALHTRGGESFAMDDYKKANKIANGQCVDCLKNALKFEMMLGKYKDVIATATDLEKITPKEADKATAAVLAGNAWLGLGGDKPKPAQLTAADAAFRDALTHDATEPSALYQDGRVLAMLNRDDDARAQWKILLGVISARDPYATRARHFYDDPQLAREKMAPAFTVTTLEGKTFNLDDMGGRVVLIDFWATWCGPCNEELPNVKKMAHDFKNDPFVLISVSWDASEKDWKTFIDKNEMTWNQYRDSDHKLSNAFGVQAIPHYFTIDSDGVLKAEMLGSGNDVEGKLKKLIVKAKAAQTAQATASSGQ